MKEYYRVTYECDFLVKASSQEEAIKEAILIWDKDPDGLWDAIPLKDIK